MGSWQNWYSSGYATYREYRALSIQPKSPVWIFGNFWQRVVPNFEKEEDLGRYAQPTHRKFPLHREKNLWYPGYPAVFFPFNFAPGISRIFGWMVRISEIQQFSEFLETIQGNFWTFVTADIYDSFGWMKAKELV